MAAGPGPQSAVPPGRGSSTLLLFQLALSRESLAVADGDAVKEMCGKKSHASSALNVINLQTDMYICVSLEHCTMSW